MVYTFKKDKLFAFQRSTFYAGITIFSSLPCSQRVLKNERQNWK